MTAKNVGWLDAWIRALVGVALLLVSASLQDRPLLTLAIGFIAVAVLGTALFRVCPLYTLLRVDTLPGNPQLR